MYKDLRGFFSLSILFTCCFQLTFFSLFHFTPDHIKDVEKVLIIGGGAVGIELAGELATGEGGQKREITLLHSGSRLLSSREDLKEQLGTTLYEQLLSLNVHVILNEKVDFSSFGAEASERILFKYFLFFFLSLISL